MMFRSARPLQPFSMEETKLKYTEALPLSLGSEKKAILLRMVVDIGIGPYAALAVDMLCDQIQHNANMISWGNNIEVQTQAHLTKQAYLDTALKKSPVIGLYFYIKTLLLSLNQVEFKDIYVERPVVVDQTKVEILLQYFAFKNLMEKYADDYKILSDELIKYSVEELKSTPQQVIELALKKNDIATDGPLAEIALKQLPTYLVKISEVNSEPVLSDAPDAPRPQVRR